MVIGFLLCRKVSSLSHAQGILNFQESGPVLLVTSLTHTDSGKFLFYFILSVQMSIPRSSLILLKKQIEIRFTLNPWNTWSKCLIKKFLWFFLSIETYPENTDANSITYVWILVSTIPSIPSEIFTKFPNLIQFECVGERVQEIKRETFWHGIHLETINVQNNELTFLHKDTFKGENFQIWSFCNFDA
jgi:hypothetical protein